jgi:hypothetical protein
MNLVDLMLGPGPYVLIRFVIDEDGDLAADIQAGNGIDDARSALLLTLANLGPLTPEEIAELSKPAALPCGCSA